MATRTVLFLDQGALKGVSSTADSVSAAGLVSGAADITLARNGAANSTVTIDANSVNFGSDLVGLEVASSTFALANITATTINFGGAATTLNVGVAGGLSDIRGNAIVRGDLTVIGTTITTHEQSLEIGDSYIDMNYGDTAPGASTGGMVVNYNPTATNDTVAAGGFTAGVPATSNPTVATTGAAVFAAADIIQISGATQAANNGLFEVKTHAANVLTIQGIGLTGTVEDFSRNQFVTSAGAVGVIRKINVSVMRAGTDAVWEMGWGSATPIAYSDLASGATTTLQIAYNNGQTITTAAAKGNMTINGTEDLIIGGSVDVSLSTTGTVTQTGAGQVTLNGNIDATNGLDVTVANLTVGGANFSVTPAGVMTVASTSNLNGAVNIGDAAGDNVAMNGTITTGLYFNTGAKIIGFNTANPETLSFDNAGIGDLTSIAPGTHNVTDLGTNGLRWKLGYFQGDVTTAGNFVSGATITVNGTTNTISGTAGLTLDPTTTLTAIVTDNTAGAFKVWDGADNYIVVDTTNAAEVISIGNAVTNPAINLLGTGTLTLGGGLTVTGATQLNGTTGLGDAAADTVTIKGNVLVGAGGINPTFGFASSGAVTAAGNPTFNFGTSLSTFGGAATVTGLLTANGSVDLGDNIADTITVTGAIDSNVYFATGAKTLGYNTANPETLTIDNAGVGTLTIGLGAGVTDTVNVNGLVGTNLYFVTGAKNLGFSSANAEILTLTNAGAGAMAVSIPEGNLTVGVVTLDYATGEISSTAAIEIDPTTTLTMTLTDNTANALSVVEGANVYIDCTTTNGAETITLGNAVSVPKINNVLGDNLANAFTIKEAGNVYLSVTTTNAAETMTFGGATNPSFLFDGSGTVDVTGATHLNGAVNLGDAAGDNIDIIGTITSAAVTFTDANHTIQTTSSANNRTLTFDNPGAGRLDVIINDNLTVGVATMTGATGILSSSAALALDPTTTLTLTLTDNTASALLATEAGNAYIDCTTTNGAEAVTIGNTLTKVNGVVGDNLANAFTIKEAGNSYLDVTTTNAAEAMIFGNAVTNPTFTFLGTGAINVKNIGETFVAGPAGVTQNYVVYKNATASEVAHAIASALSTSNTITGVAHATKGAAADVIVDNVGIVTLDAEAGIAVSAGDIVYLSATSAGEVTNVAPTASTKVVAVVGYAKTSCAAGATFTAYWAPRTPYLIP
jgi:molybdopterin-binding protein